MSTADGALTVNVPAGALSVDTRITITEIASPAAGGIGKTYDIGPSGTQFAVPVKLAFNYGAIDLQGNDPTLLEVATIANGQWVPLMADAVDTTTHVASGETTHLSPYGIHLRGNVNSRDAGDDATVRNDASVSDSSVSDSSVSDSSVSDGSVADSSPADASIDASSDSASSDGGATDAGFDASGCTPGALQVGSCANHPMQICSGNYYFTNCVDLSPGITYDCCPGG